jgi:hypothetical protein
VLSGWVLYLIEEIKNKISLNEVLYDGENVYLREKKLKEVTNEYSKKYTYELGELASPST